MKNSTILISIFLMLTFSSYKSREMGAGWRFDNVKSWNISVSVEGTLRTNEGPGAFDSTLVKTEVAGTIEDKKLAAGKHHIWPFGNGTEGSHLQTHRMKYVNLLHIPGEKHRLCSTIKGTATAGMSIDPNGTVYGVWVAIPSMDLFCNTEDKKRSGEVRLEVNQIPLPEGNVLQGTRTVTDEDKVVYNVSWEMTPATFD